MQINDLPPDRAFEPMASTDEQPPESDFPFYRKLGRTDLTVSCLGIGGGGGISSNDTLYAFEQGINYFFYSSDLHHFVYRSMAGGIRDLCKRGSSVRDKVVLATVTYIKQPEVALSALYDQFQELGLDYIDIFFWGWIDASNSSAFNNCLKLSPDLRGPRTVYQRTIEKIIGTSEHLKKMGAVRYVGASFHDLNLANQYLDNSLLDVVMVRHNVSHRSAQHQVFNCLEPQNPQRPGISTFKSTNAETGVLWDSTSNLPQGWWRPSVPDLYRYSLSQNCVDVCLTGMRKREEIDLAIAGMQQGRLTQEEVNYLNIYGDLHRKKLSIKDVSEDQLIYRTHN